MWAERIISETCSRVRGPGWQTGRESTIAECALLYFAIGSPCRQALTRASKTTHTAKPSGVASGGGSAHGSTLTFLCEGNGVSLLRIFSFFWLALPDGYE